MSLPLVDDGLRFSVHAMVRKSLTAGSTRFSGIWTWRRDGEEIASISFYIEAHEKNRAVLTLSYQTDGQKILYDVPLIAKPCRFGGQRWFAICPRTQKQVAKLYKPCGARYFYARTAWRLAYRSQRNAPGFSHLCGKRDRLAFVTLKGDNPECPQKPKWMRWHTYEAHMAKLDALHEEMDKNFLERFRYLYLQNT